MIRRLMVSGAVCLRAAAVGEAQSAPQPSAVLRGVTELRGFAQTPSGYRVRTMVTRPNGIDRLLPAILFVQWLSCDPVALPPSGGDGWSRMLRGIIENSGMIVARTEKPGMGDSEGPPCGQLGYLEELAAHRAALRELRRSPGVHPDSIFLFGGSMGGTMVALLAADEPVRGVIVWGSTGLSWFEHMVALDRRVMELQGTGATDIARWMPDHERLHRAYLIDRASPSELGARDPSLAAAWTRMLGTSPTDHYGRPFAFHQEAQGAAWGSAWERVHAPVLVVRGQYDWIMSAAEHQRIVDIVSARGVHAEFVTVPRLDHNFDVASSDAAAFRGEVQGFDPAVVDVLFRWLDRRRRP